LVTDNHQDILESMCSLVIPTWQAEIMLMLQDEFYVFAHVAEAFMGMQELLLVCKTIVYEWEVSSE
jgi:hypothetical protein